MVEVIYWNVFKKRFNLLYIRMRSKSYITPRPSELIKSTSATNIPKFVGCYSNNSSAAATPLRYWLTKQNKIFFKKKCITYACSTTTIYFFSFSSPLFLFSLFSLVRWIENGKGKQTVPDTFRQSNFHFHRNFFFLTLFPLLSDLWFRDISVRQPP